MFKQIIETIFRVLGFRKLGATDQPDERDYTTNKIKASQINIPEKTGKLDMRGNPPKDQGRTNHCFHGDVEVLMSDFTQRPIRDVSAGDYVITHKGNVRQVTKKYQNIWQGNSFKIKTIGNYRTPECTPNHPFLTQDGWKEAKKITTDDYLALPCLKKIEKDLTISPFESDPDFLWCIGLFLADGNFNEYSTIFNLNTTTKLNHGKKLKETMEKLGANISWYEYGEQNLKVTITGKYWKEIFYDLCGEYCDKKRINRRLMFLDPFQQLNIFWGWHAGDGNSNFLEAGRCMVSTTSKELLCQMQQILLRNELTATIIKRKEYEGKKQGYELNFYMTEKTDTTKNKRDKWSFFKDGYMFVRVREIEKFPSYTSGNVYNLEVEKDESYIADGFVVHNCTAYALAAVVESMLIRKLKKFVTVDPQQFVINQKARRYLLGLKSLRQKWDIDKEGDTLQNALQACVDNKIHFLDYLPISGEKWPRTVKFEGYARVEKSIEDISEWVEKGHPIYTGTNVWDNYVDSEGYWQTRGKKKRGGHAFHLPQIRNDEPVLENSWGQRWNGEGTAPIRNLDIRDLYTPYVLYGMEID